MWPTQLSGTRLADGGVCGRVSAAFRAACKPSGYPNADLYQVLAYCTVLGLKVGRLIYAKGNGDRGFILGATTPAK